MARTHRAETHQGLRARHVPGSLLPATPLSVKQFVAVQVQFSSSSLQHQHSETRLAYLIVAAAVPSRRNLFSLFPCTIQHCSLLAWLAPPDSAIANPLSTPRGLSSQSALCLGLLLPRSPGCCWLPPPTSPDPSPLLPPHAQPWGPTFHSSLVCQFTLPSQSLLSLLTCPRALDVVSPSPGPSLIFPVLNSLFLQAPTSSILHKPQCSGFSSSFLCVNVASPMPSSLLCCNKQIQNPP